MNPILLHPKLREIRAESLRRKLAREALLARSRN